MAQAVTDADWGETVVEASKATPVLVDFWAPWCPPCRMVAPVLDQIGDELAGALTIAKINADENQRVMETYGVLGLPTLLLFKGGEPVASIVGFQPKQRLLAKIRPYL